MFLCQHQAFWVIKAQTPQVGRINNNGAIVAATPQPNSAGLQRH
jgi:hypothetical protein